MNLFSKLRTQLETRKLKTQMVALLVEALIYHQLLSLTLPLDPSATSSIKERIVMDSSLTNQKFCQRMSVFRMTYSKAMNKVTPAI